jgi:hypothetical protein
MSAADELLADVHALRRRARADRHAYWFPLLFFGLAIAAAAPLYVESLPPAGTGNDLYLLYPDGRIGPYWTVVLLGGALLTAWWYRRQGRRIGIEGRVGPALVTATLAVIGWLLIRFLPVDLSFLGQLTSRNYTALLVIAAGLLALGWEERSLGLAVIAGLFTAAVVLANTYDPVNLTYRLHWHLFDHRLDQLPALLLPAVVLLAGAAAAALRSSRSR